MNKPITVSLETAKQLKEKGFPQDTFWYWEKWIEPHEGESIEHYRYIEEWHPNDQARLFAAPTAEEILERLPQTTIEYGKGWIGVFAKGHDDGDEHSLAEALAKTWLYLAEKGSL